MNQILNFILTLLFAGMLGVTCLFLLVLSDYKEEIWNSIQFENERDLK